MALLKRCAIKMDGQGFLLLTDRNKSFGHDDLTAKHHYFRCSRLPDADRIKIFDKDDQATKRIIFCSLVNTLDIINIRRCMPRLHVAWGSSHCWAGILFCIQVIYVIVKIVTPCFTRPSLLSRSLVGWCTGGGLENPKP